MADQNTNHLRKRVDSNCPNEKTAQESRVFLERFF